MTQIAHIVLLGFTADATDTQKRACADALAGLKPLIPGLLSYSGGVQISSEAAGQGIDFGFTMIFADMAARDAYLPHPEHQRVIRDFIAPILRSVQVLDYELAV